MRMSRISISLTFALLIFLSVVNASGCRNALAEYKKSARSILEEALESTDKAEDNSIQVPTSTNYDEAIAKINTSAANLQTCLEEFEGFLEEAESLVPPKKVEAFHTEMLNFFAGGVKTYEETSKLTTDLAGILQAYFGTLKAMENFSLSSSIKASEVQSLIDAVQTSTNGLQSFTLSSTIPEAQQLKQGAISAMEAELATYRTLKQLIASYSKSLETQYNALQEDYLRKTTDFINLTGEIGDRFGVQVKEMEKKCKDLMDQLESLK